MPELEALVPRLDALARRAMDHWRVPGLALAVAARGQAPVLRTYGRRDTLHDAPVTPRTQFNVCSLTKGVTAAGLLLLLRERGLPVTTKVRDLLPGFRLADACATEHLTLRDLLCHASGLPRHDKLWTPGDLSRAELLDRLRHVAAGSGLRERYQYCNLGYVVLAAVTEALAGTEWETHTRTALLGPLGWRGAGFTPRELEAAADHAHPHPRDGAGIVRGKAWPAPAPAGGLNASIADMALWLQALVEGALPGVSRESSQAILEEMTTPWMYTGKSAHPEIGAGHYGLGLACEHYRGRRVVAHSGSMPGWGALLTFLQEEGVGVVVLTNRDPSPLPQMLAFAVYDAVCGLEPVDWYGRYAAAREKALAEELAEKEKGADVGGVPTRALAEYAGRYGEAAYGVIEVSLDGDELAWSWRGLHGTLKALGFDRFRLDEAAPARHAEPLEATFLYDAKGKVDRAAMRLEPEVAEIVFVRLP